MPLARANKNKCEWGFGDQHRDEMKEYILGPAEAWEVEQSEITCVHLFTGYGTWIRPGGDDRYECETTRSENDARR
jgi:hypothetical protein